MDAAFGANFFGLGNHALKAQRREHGYQHQCHHEGGDQRVGDGECLIAKELAGNPLDKDDGQKDADGGGGRGDDGAAYFAGPAHGRSQDTQPLVAVALHAFQDHNGVVNQHPDPQSQPAQRHDVETDVRAEHQEKGRDHGEGDRQADDGRAFEVAEKEEEDDNGEDAAEDGGVEHLVNGLLDKGRLVKDNLHAAALKQGGVFREKFV